MKKILTNKKGFTLIELLAVIVVLAIIMVIATQQVNGTIKKSRANTFVESMQTVVKSAKMVWAQENKLDQESLKNEVDLSDADYELKVVDNCIQLKGKGKFANMDLTDTSIKVPSQYKKVGKDTLSVKVDVEGNETQCDISTGTGSTGN
ncbi:MAG: Tfp pilus assembly protein FimT/FimU [Lachnospiraceae bacterium]